MGVELIKNLSTALPKSFFYRHAKIVAPDLIGCFLVKREKNHKLLWGVIIETEAYSQEEPGCHGHKRRSQSNETLFGDPGHFYVYLTYGIYHCVNIVTDRKNYASGVLLRSIALPGEDERVAAGPALLARRFGLDRNSDNCPLSLESGLWVSDKPSGNKMKNIIATTRIGITKAQDLPWRWYQKNSRSVSKRAKGDRCPSKREAFNLSKEEYQ